MTLFQRTQPLYNRNRVLSILKADIFSSRYGDVKRVEQGRCFFLSELVGAGLENTFFVEFIKKKEKYSAKNYSQTQKNVV